MSGDIEEQLERHILGEERVVPMDVEAGNGGGSSSEGAASGVSFGRRA